MLHLLSSLALGASLTVGPDQTYERVSDAINASSPGDEIVVQSGEYVDDTVSFPHGALTIRGDGRAQHQHVVGVTALPSPSCGSPKTSPIEKGSSPSTWAWGRW